MKDSKKQHIGTSYAHENQQLRAQNPLYSKTTPSRFDFNNASKDKQQAQGFDDHQLEFRPPDVFRELRKSAFVRNRKAQMQPHRQHGRNFNG